MVMTKQHFIFLSLWLAGGFSVADSYTDTATVSSFEKITAEHNIREPYQDCYIKKFYKNEGDDSYTNEILGGILGGAIGNQFGKGRGKDAMTVAGTLLGASIANDEEKNNQVAFDRRVCETKYRYFTERQFSHYSVKYDYQGKTFSYASQHKPEVGSTIKVRVNVSPL